ncbi:MAG: hypothetical protein GF416_02965 [Candidatus Altiarchaeales archaeon]|nr:hypothetical protein [Candidatus Altiarchaeales archaeon]MBD3416081.1 hypothetical protein [Candidatus Altiarchaeales archaeon]
MKYVPRTGGDRRAHAKEIEHAAVELREDGRLPTQRELGLRAVYRGHEATEEGEYYWRIDPSSTSRKLFRDGFHDRLPDMLEAIVGGDDDRIKRLQQRLREEGSDAQWFDATHARDNIGLEVCLTVADALRGEISRKLRGERYLGGDTHPREGRMHTQEEYVWSEMSRNIIEHGRRGLMITRPITDGERRGVEFIGLNPGRMTDIPRHLHHGESTKLIGLVGHGLCYVRAHVDELEIRTDDKKGTITLARIWRPTKKE